MSTRKRRTRKPKTDPALRNWDNFPHYYAQQGLCYAAFRKAKPQDFERLHYHEASIGMQAMIAAEDATGTPCQFKHAVGRKRQRAVRIKDAAKQTVTTIPIAEADLEDLPISAKQSHREWRAEIVELVSELNRRAGLTCLSETTIEDTIQVATVDALSIPDFIGNFAMAIGAYRIPPYDAGRIATYVSTRIALTSRDVNDLRQCILKAALWRVEKLDRKRKDDTGPEQLTMLGDM